MMSVEVVYAKADTQVIISVQVEEGATIEDAIHCSGILQRFPEIDLSIAKVGIFSQLSPLTKSLNSADRVEIYRRLLIEAKQARLLRAKRARK